ncbi:MAG: hypothetical protein LBR28_05925 [Bacteroidales bacterium]|jgi:hypothetical protein|nr:hypothetical protein [Bacteroidales bacterium]
MKYKVTYLLFVFFISFATFAQCPYGNGTKINCIYGCGRFIDNNNDGFCDNGKVEKAQPQQITDIDSSQIKKRIDTNTESVDKMPVLSDKNQEKKKKNKDFTPQKQNDEVEIQYSVVETSPLPQNDLHTVSENITQPVQYPFIYISIGVLLLYFFSIFLVKMNTIRKITHRKIWNTTLLLTFICSCIGGLFLVIQLNYGVAMKSFSFILKLHVWTGIAMALIGVIHICWHLPYFRKLLSKPRNS